MTATDKTRMQKAVADLPAELQEVVSLWADRLHEQSADLPGQEHALQVLLHLAATSDFAARVLLREWDWFQSALTSGELSVPPQEAVTRKFIDDFNAAGADKVVVKSRLRQFRNRQLTHILWRTIEGSGNLQESLWSLSNLADGLIEAAVACSGQLLSPRFGIARNADGQEIPLVVLAMGKLGGRELNFSSDVDLIFLYREEGETDGSRSISAHEYFTRRTRQIVALLDEVTADGFVYRCDRGRDGLPNRSTFRSGTDVSHGPRSASAARSGSETLRGTGPCVPQRCANGGMFGRLRSGDPCRKCARARRPQ